MRWFENRRGRGVGRRKASAIFVRYGIGLIFAVWASDGRAQSGAARTVDLRIEKGALIGAQAGNVVRVKEGESLVLIWTADETVELHLHGYDIELTVKPGAPESMIFEAFATGRFPISQHGHGSDGNAAHMGTLGYLEVLPR